MLLKWDGGNMNDSEICRGWVGDWIRRSKAGEIINSRYDLSSGQHVKGIWDAAANNDAIDNGFGLVCLSRKTNTNHPIPTTWIAEELTKGKGYFIFAVRGKTLNLKKGKYDGTGHAMATRNGYGPLHFFDPNEGLMEFTNSLEFHDFLPTYIRNNYPGLLSREGEVMKF